MPNKRKKDAATLATLARANAKTIARQQVEKKLRSVWRPVVSRKVYEQHQRSGNTTFRLLIGYDKSGRKIMPQFGTARFTALAFQEAWNSAVQSNSQTDLTILNDVAQIDVRWAISELEKINCTLRQAVDFFLLHALPEGGFLKFDEAMERYYEIQKEKNLSKSSTDKNHTVYKTYFKPLVDFFGDKELIQITSEDVRKYLEKRGANWSERHYNDHLNYGRRFWNVLAGAKFCSAELNPFDHIPRKRKKLKRESQKIMHPRDIRAFFWFVEEQAKTDFTKHQELALMALTFFCGVRVEEAEKCEWNQINKNVKPREIDETTWRLTIWSSQEKTSATKINPIPKAAQFWLAEAEKHKWRGKIVHDDYRQRMKRLRSAFKKQQKENGNEIVIPTNTARHTYCSMHLGLYNNYNLTVQRMKHGTVNTMKQNYEATVQPEHAVYFFEIFPKQVTHRMWREKGIQNEKEWAAKGINGWMEQKYFQLLLAHSENVFTTLCTEYGLTELEATHSIENHTPIRLLERGKTTQYMFEESNVLQQFQIIKEGNPIPMTNPKNVELREEDLKFLTKEFFEIPDVWVS